MRRWRVGSITLGLALIALGIGMLLSRILGTFSLADVAAWWPVLLIVLGAEVLLALFLSDEKLPKVVYDGGSIFLIALVLVFSMCIGAVDYVASHIPGGLERLLTH
jgi:uncharacterized membrane protein YcaP (DUF421 family)